MASIKTRKTKDGKTRYYAQVRLKGYDPECASFERLTDARKWIQETEVAIREGRHFKTSEAKKHTFGEMIDRYISSVLPMKPKCIKCQGAQLLWWKEQIGNRVLARLLFRIEDRSFFLLNGLKAWVHSFSDIFVVIDVT
jgi:hypothetical protein